MQQAPLQTRLWLLVGALGILIALLPWIRLVQQDGNLTRVLRFGDHYADRVLEPLLQEKRVIFAGNGFDGQFYVQQALDPLLLKPETARAMDDPKFRSRRPLFPGLAWALSMGRSGLVLWIYPCLNLAAWFVLLYLLWRWLPQNTAGLAAFFAIGLGPGVVESASRALPDLPAFVLALLGLQTTGALSLAWLAGAGLGRETMLLSHLGRLDWTWFHKTIRINRLSHERADRSEAVPKDKQGSAKEGISGGSFEGAQACFPEEGPASAGAFPAITGLREGLRWLLGLGLAALPLAAWWAYLEFRFPTGLPVDGDNLGLPLLGWLQRWAALPGEWLADSEGAKQGFLEWRAPQSAALLLSHGVQVLFLFLHRRTNSPWWRWAIATALLSLCLTWYAWSAFYSVSRHLLPLHFAFNWLLVQPSTRPKHPWCWFALGNLYALPRLLYWLDFP